MTLRSDETWERLLALSPADFKSSIRACERYLASPEGVAEFGLLEMLSKVECNQIFDEAFRQSASSRDKISDLTRRVEKLEKAR